MQPKIIAANIHDSTRPNKVAVMLELTDEDVVFRRASQVQL